MKRTGQYQKMRDKLKVSRETGEPVWITLGSDRMKIKAVNSQDDLLFGYNACDGEFIIHTKGRIHWPVELITKDAFPHFRVIGPKIVGKYIKFKNILAIILERHKREPEPDRLHAVRAKRRMNPARV